MYSLKFNLIRRSLIAMLLLAFSVSALSVQTNLLPAELDAQSRLLTSLELPPVNTVVLQNEHCTSSTTIQNCNACSHCSLASEFNIRRLTSLVIFDILATAMYSDINMDVPIKPPKNK